MMAQYPNPGAGDDYTGYDCEDQTQNTGPSPPDKVSGHGGIGVSDGEVRACFGVGESRNKM